MSTELNETETIKVRAVNLGDSFGWYPNQTPEGDDYKRRRDGDVFLLYPRHCTVVDKVFSKPVRNPDGTFQTKLVTAEAQLSRNWMERVDDDEPVSKSTGAGKALKNVTEEIKASRRPG